APGTRPLQQYQPRDKRQVPSTAYDSHHAVLPVAKIIESLSDYRADDGTNTQSEGARIVVKHEIGSGSTDAEWEGFAHASQVSARWVFQREVLRRFRGALDVASTAEGKFDARVSIGSNA